jgi:cob(I)alamin adenosyltransferase
MSIATKTGDRGETSLLGGKRVKKTDARIEAYGTIDELNAILGVCMTKIHHKEINTVLSRVQNDLFRIGAELSALGTDTKINIPKITDKQMKYVDEALIDIETTLPVQKEFILPRGTESSALLHLARTICRRAERATIKCEEVSPLLVQYLNRLSDLLFLFARKENQGYEQPVTYE